MNTIVLPTVTAAALWNAVIKGQLSDGYYENLPRIHRWDHWRFWCQLDGVHGPTPGIVLLPDTYPRRPVKWAYRFTDLIPYVGKEMIAVARMALSNDGAAPIPEDAFRAAGYMPRNLAEWEASRKTGTWTYGFVAKYMEAVTPEMARRFYELEATYGERELRADIRAIRAVMLAYGETWGIGR